LKFSFLRAISLFLLLALSQLPAHAALEFADASKRMEEMGRKKSSSGESVLKDIAVLMEEGRLTPTRLREESLSEGQLSGNFRPFEIPSQKWKELMPPNPLVVTTNYLTTPSQASQALQAIPQVRTRPAPLFQQSTECCSFHRSPYYKNGKVILGTAAALSFLGGLASIIANANLPQNQFPLIYAGVGMILAGATVGFCTACCLP
jgi:hypothetical protein